MNRLRARLREMTQKASPSRGAAGSSSSTSSSAGSSAGFTLVELLVAMLVLTIAISMSFIVATNMDQVTVSTIRQGRASEAAESGIAEVAQYLRGIVSPTAAAAARGSTVASKSSCWGQNSPAPPGGANLSAEGAANLAVVTAYDFDIVYCGYAPATSSPSSSRMPGVYEITFAPGSCQGVGYCTLAVYFCGANYNPGTAAVPFTASYLRPSSCVQNGDVVYDVQRVWCDTACQSGTAGTSPGDTPSLFNYYAGSAGQYAGTGTVGGALNSSAHPLGLAPGDDAPGLQLVQLVVLRATVLANSNPYLAVTGAGSGTQVSEQVWLDNMAQGGFQPPSASSAELRFGPDGAWPLDSDVNGVVTDISGNGNYGTVQGSVDFPSGGSPPLDAPLSVPVASFSGSGFISTANSVQPPGPEVFSVSAWFSTTSDGGIIQYADSETGYPQSYDRQLYVGTDGKLTFGVCDPNVTCNAYQGWVPQTIQSLQSVADGTWHFAVATLSSAGMSLYLDGQLVAYDSSVTEAQQFTDQGWWRIGGLGNQCGWPDTPWSNGQAGCSAFDFTGELADVAVYPEALSASQVQALYEAAGHYSTCFSYLEAANQPSSMWMLSEPAPIGWVPNRPVADEAPVQDGNTGTIQGVVSEGSTPGAAACDTSVPAMSFSGLGYISTLNDIPGPQTFSIVAWFKTRQDGGIVSFGNSETGQSTDYDRHLYVGTDGKLHFGVWPGYQSIVSSPGTVNDGSWHLAVATLSYAGQYLYLDGSLVGESTNTAAQSYNGFWRIGEMAGPGWNYEGSGEFPFHGYIADVAIYPYALSGAQVQALYEAGQLS